MGVILKKCPNCGGNLELDDSLEKGYCQYCGNEVIVKEDNITNVTNNNITNSNVTIVTDQKDFEIKASVLIKYNGESDVVVIPDNVKKIGKEAFKGMEIKEITIPNSVTEIGESAFEGCELREVTIPNNVTEIRTRAFYNCKSLKK